MQKMKNSLCWLFCYNHELEQEVTASLSSWSFQIILYLLGVAKCKGERFHGVALKVSKGCLHCMNRNEIKEIKLIQSGTV